MYFKSQGFKHYSWAFLALLLLGIPLFFNEKEFLNLWLNQYHSPLLDTLFKYITHLGNAWVLLPLFLFVLSRDYFLSLVLLFTVLLESLFVQVFLKHGFFEGLARPLKYISQSDLLHQVEGVNIHTMNTFPSGHTQTIFVIITFLALFCKRKSSVYILLFIGAIVGLSRVYLLQHFFIDIWVGSMIGYIFPLIVYGILSFYFKPNLNPDKPKQPIRIKRK